MESYFGPIVKKRQFCCSPADKIKLNGDLDRCHELSLVLTVIHRRPLWHPLDFSSTWEMNCIFLRATNLVTHVPVLFLLLQIQLRALVKVGKKICDNVGGITAPIAFLYWEVGRSWRRGGGGKKIHCPPGKWLQSSRFWSLRVKGEMNEIGKYLPCRRFSSRGGQRCRDVQRNTNI